MFKRKLLTAALYAACLSSLSTPAVAEPVTQVGQAEVSIKANKDQISARAVARKAAEYDAIRAAIKLKLNIEAKGAKADEAIAELVKSLGPNLKTTYVTEGDMLTARTTLNVDSVELTDLSRSLGLQNMNVMEAASIVFLIDEYWGISTNLDPSKPLVSEVEFLQDKSSFSDTSLKASSSGFSDTSSKSSGSAYSDTSNKNSGSSYSDSSNKSSGSAYSDTSSKASSNAAYQGSLAASSKESGSYSSNQKAAASGNNSTAISGADRGSLATNGTYGGSLMAARDTQISGSHSNSVSGSAQSSISSNKKSDNRIAASENSSSSSASDNKNVRSISFSADSKDTRFNASAADNKNVRSISSSADTKNIHADSSSTDQKNIVTQNDITKVRTKTVFPDVNNAKPSDISTSFITQRLAQVTKRYGLEYTPERDMRETGKGRMLISDIENQRRFEHYTQLAGKNPYNAKYVVFGSSVMNAEGLSPSGRTLCSGMLKLDSFNVDTGRGLIAGTLVKRAEGGSDQDCRNNLATALATELAETVGNGATRELQRIARMGQSYTVTLFSTARITRGIGGPFEDALRELAGGELREDKRTDATRIYTLSAKGGDLSRRLEKLLDSMGEGMKSAEVQAKGNRVVVCVEGRCPTDY